MNKKGALTLISMVLILILLFTLSSCSKKDPVKIPPAVDSPQSSEDKSDEPNPAYSQENPGEPGGAADNGIPDATPSSLSNKKLEWGLSPSKNHSTPGVPGNVVELLKKYSGYYVGDTGSRVIYLTFDEGYENGYTSRILDTLRANNVKAAFFVTRPYILSNKDLIQRMVSEGHLVCNHTSRHPSMPSRADDINAFNREFTDTEDAFKSVTGLDMPRFFRPPMGEYSERSLCFTQKLGYKTIFWSFAHYDWDVNKQPSVETTLKRVMDRSHNGEIMLLHAVSKSNSDAMDQIIKSLQAEGYRFGTLDELK